MEVTAYCSSYHEITNSLRYLKTEIGLFNSFFHEEAPHTCEALARRIWVVLDMAGEAGGGMLRARQDSHCPITWRFCSRNLRDHGKGASLFTFPCAITFS